MKVLVLGASGLIGSAVAQALVRGGHIVYGLTRTEEKAKKLASEEVIPLIGDVSDTSKWLTSSLISTVDVIITALGHEADLSKVDPKLLVTITKLATESRPSHAPKLTYIYTSGSWLYGQDPNIVLSDTSAVPPAQIPLIAQSRLALEQEIISSSTLNGIIIRPGCVYGKSGTSLTPLFGQAKEGNIIRWFIPKAGNETGGGRLNTIHTDDLAQLYLLAAEKSQLVGGNVFAGVNDATESVDDILTVLVKISGAKGFEYSVASNPFEAAIASTNIVRPYLARSLLGWRPVKASVVDHLQIYFDAWKASNGKA
ncbi:NAD(P)-binding protein [Abortiporus biennis]|nr:NAD(P)-binding protein [Abortiporus biennis]